MEDKERREFRMHKDMLWSVIKSQAGTFDKAVLELLMNAVDAGATEVCVEFDGKTFSVQDDGKGFAGREEIVRFFETFGTPHQAGDATYGKFRMGRGQIMAFTRNLWRSGQFRMEVDIKEKGLAYDLVTLAEEAVGCRIEGELYDPMSPSDTIRTIDGLASMCKYMPIPVYINDKRASIPMDDVKWTMEDEDAYYKLNPEGQMLEAYNLGVMVRRYYGAQACGVGGIVVSKVALETNFARNDLLVAQCEVWKRITAKLKQYAAKHQEKRPKQDEPYRVMMLDRILSGAFDDAQEFMDALTDAKVVTDYSGKHFSFESLCNRVEKLGRLVALEAHSHTADRVHQKQLALVVSPKFMDRAQGAPMKAILQRIDANLSTFGVHAGQYMRVRLARLIERIKPLDEVAGSMSEDHDIVDEKDLSKEENVVLRVLNRMAEWMAYRLELQPRKVRVCSSDSVDGFTDGKSVIFVERKFLKVPGYAGALFAHFDNVKQLLIHEFVHEEDDSTGHGHPAEFYERYHDITAERLHSWVYDTVRRYLSERKKSGLKMRSAEMGAFDMMGFELDTPPSNDETQEKEQHAAAS